MSMFFFSACWRNIADGVFAHRRQPPAAPRSQPHLAGFELRQFQHVVDERPRSSLPAARHDVSGLAVLLLGQVVRREQHFAETR